MFCFVVATALTVYGIETLFKLNMLNQLTRQLQQLLPFTVLKLPWIAILEKIIKQVATALTVYGIETRKENGEQDLASSPLSCNSSYRLRY